MSEGSLSQSAGRAAAKERAPSVGSIFYVGGSSRALLFLSEERKYLGLAILDHQKGRGEALNILESEKQDLELNSLYERQPVKLSQYRSRTMRGATLCTRFNCLQSLRNSLQF